MASRPERLRVASLSEPSTAPAAPISCWIGLGGDTLAAALAADGPNALESSCGWRLAAIGGERRATASAWAARTGASEAASIRDVAHGPTAVHLILGREMPGEADLDALLGNESLVVGTAPLPANTLDAYRIGDRRARLRTVPLLRWSDAYRVAQPLVEEFLSEGPASGVAVRLRSTADETGLCSVDSMLIDACDIVLDLLPGVESVWAVGRSPSSTTDARVLAAIARSREGAVISIDLADGGGWERSVELIGPAGRLRIADDAILRWNRAGQLTERIDLTGPTDAVGACVEALRTLARLRGGREDLGRQVARLAFADAARLSLRTGNAESPSSVEEIAARP